MRLYLKGLKWMKLYRKLLKVRNYHPPVRNTRIVRNTNIGYEFSLSDCAYYNCRMELSVYNEKQQWKITQFSGSSSRKEHSKPTKKFNNNNSRVGTISVEDFKKKKGYCSDGPYVIIVKTLMKLVCLLQFYSWICWYLASRFDR